MDGRAVADVGADLQRRNARYHAGIERLRRGSVRSRADEVGWFAERGVLGRLVEGFNPARPPDPGRWDAVIGAWDRAGEGFTAALAVPVSVEEINKLGQVSSEAMRACQLAVESDRACREQFLAYLEGFTGSADALHTVATIGRDVAFGAAVAVATVVAAPAVAAAATVHGLGGAATAALTLGAAGATGAAIEGAGLGLSTLGGQAGMALSDVLTSAGNAADRFNFAEVRHQSWVGFKQGFVDGVLGVAGIRAEQALAGVTARTLDKLLGPRYANLWKLVLHRALTRAVAGGATGAVIGGLQAGYRAAEEGKDLPGITAAVKDGFTGGAALGAAAGAVGGAKEAAHARHVRKVVLSELGSRATDSVGPSLRFIYAQLDELQMNPDAGTNRQLLALVPKVAPRLMDPNAVAEMAVEIFLERRLIGPLTAQGAAPTYGQTVEHMSRRTGAPTIVLPRDERFTPEAFFRQVVVSGNRFVDRAVVKSNSDHGVYTHMIQDLIADKALAPFGLRAEQFRALLKDAVGKDGTNRVGRFLWQDVYDSLRLNANRPEIMYPALREALPGLE